MASSEERATRVRRTFRLFVSSTFTDLQEERDALHRTVFPALRSECALHGARFQAIDLRWGVSTEAGLDQKTMPLCLGEIEHCQRTDRPNFIVLLGDRYGWRPLPATIPAYEFEQIHDRMTPDQAVLLDSWYLRDDNALQPEYYLRSRDHDGRFGLSAEGQAAWQGVEQHLGAALRATVDRLGLPNESRARYSPSATEQEIVRGALGVPDAAEHVFCFFRTIQELPHDDTSTRFEDIVDGRVDREAAGLLATLKERLHRHVPGNVTTYNTVWDSQAAQPAASHVDQLCHDVFHRLRDVIRDRFAEDGDTTRLDVELEAHNRFGKERAGSFIGRVDELRVIAEHVERRPGRPLVVHGESGSGKSALMAKASLMSTGEEDNVVVRFIGATAASSDGRTLLSDLCSQIGGLYGDDSAVPSDFRELVEQFPRRLELATAARPLTLFLDALDQLDPSDPASSLSWLPSRLPEHVALVVSTPPGDTLDAIRRKLPEGEFAEIRSMSCDEADELLSVWLHGAQRALQSDQRNEVLRGFQANGLPLYLRLAFEEARLWRSEGEHRKLAVDIPKLIRHNLFKRLEARESHGEVLVSRALGYLAASRYGLTEDELFDVLSRDEAVSSWIRQESTRTHQLLPEVADGQQRMPAVLWSRLYADLEPYLTERTTRGATVLAFNHRQFREMAHSTYVDGAAQKHEPNARLAAYFGTQDLESPRTLEELPWELMQAGSWRSLYNLLADSAFLVAVAEHDRIGLQAYWAAIEMNTDLRISDAYRDIVANPSRDWNAAWYVAMLLFANGKWKAAEHIQDALLGHLRSIEDWDNLRSYLSNQASLLQKRGDLAGALELLDEGERICRSSETQEGLATLLNGRALILRSMGRRQEAMELLRECELLSRERGDLPNLHASLGNQARILRDTGNLDDALNRLGEQEQICREIGDTDGLQRCLNGQATILWQQGHSPEALRLLGEAERICRQLGNKHGLQTALGNRALVIESMGETDQALELFSEVEAMCRDMGNEPGLQRTLVSQAELLIDRGEAKAAGGPLDEAEAICRRIGLTGGLANVLRLQAAILETTDPRASIERLEAGREAARAFDDRELELMLVTKQAALEQALGRTAEVLECLRSQERLAREMANLGSLAKSLFGQAVIQSRLGDTVRLVELYEEIVEVSRRLDDQQGICMALGGLAVVRLGQRRVDEGLHLLEDQERCAREWGNRRWTAIALTNRAEALAGEVSVDLALPLLKEARGLAMQEGEEQILDRIDTLVLRISELRGR